MREILNRQQTILLLAVVRELPYSVAGEENRRLAVPSPFVQWATGLSPDEIKILAAQPAPAPAELRAALGREIGEAASFSETLLDTVALIAGLKGANPRESWEVLEEWSRVADINGDQKMLACLRFIGPPDEPHQATIRKEFLKALGLTSTYSSNALDEAYRSKAKAHHPDRHSSKTSEEQVSQAKLFKAVRNAYEMLQEPPDLWGSHPTEPELRKASTDAKVGCFFCFQQSTLTSGAWETTILRCKKCDAVLLHAYEDAQWLHNARSLLAQSGYPITRNELDLNEARRCTENEAIVVSAITPRPTTSPPAEDIPAEDITVEQFDKDDEWTSDNEGAQGPPGKGHATSFFQDEDEQYQPCDPLEHPLEPEFDDKLEPQETPFPPLLRRFAVAMGFTLMVGVTWLLVPRSGQLPQATDERQTQASGNTRGPGRSEEAAVSAPPPVVTNPGTTSGGTALPPQRGPNGLDTAMAGLRTRCRTLPLAEVIAEYESFAKKNAHLAGDYPETWIKLLQERIAAYDRLLMASADESPPRMETLRHTHKRGQVAHSLMKWVHDTGQNPVESELRFEEARTDYANVVRGLVIRSQAGIIDEAFKLELGTAEENMGRLYLERGERIGSIDYVSEAATWLQNAEETFGMLGSGGRSRADRVRGQQALQRQTLMRLMDRNP